MSTDEVARLTFYATLVTVLSNFLLAILTGIYVFLTRQMVKQMRTARDPSIFIDLEFPGGEAHLAIGNSGQSPGLNVRFAITEDVPWQSSAGKNGLKSLDVIRNGLSFLPPSRTLKYIAGYIDWRELKGASAIIDVKITYENESGVTFSRDYQINVAQFAEVSPETYRDSSLEVAKAIRDVEERRSMSEMTSHIFHSTKRCPICASSIPRQAKKCPECHEFLESEESPEAEQT